MPRKPTQQEAFEALLTQYDAAIAEAFRAAVADLSNAADLQAVITALSAGNISAAIDALHIDPAAFGPIFDAATQGYLASGTAGAGIANAATDVAMVIRFNIRNPRAEAWLRSRSSTQITRLVEDQRQAVRQALEAGMAKGVNPRTAGLDIVGRVNPRTGGREGGIIGLTAQQEAFARNARDELASGDPALLKNYLTRTRRDQRFDRSVIKAIREGTALPADLVGKATLRYRARLLELRGSTVGRTEAMASLHAAKHEAFLQAVEAGQIAEGDVRRVWDSAGDMRVRHTHAILDGKTVGLNEPFRSPSGALLMFPGDPGAPAAEVINCRCNVNYRVDFLSNLR